jgi:error-prone DNA polymerase
VRYAREQGILCQGRGSAVGSAVCYCLGLTAVEPLSHHLSFERFLSVGRTDPPDVDLDLPADRDGEPPAREAVIQYALNRWSGHAALVANVITFRARLAVREVGLALGLAPEHIDALAREKNPWPVTGAPHAACDCTGTPCRLHDLCARIEGLPRHLGQHPGGVVITARPLSEVAPLERARMPGRIIVQWDKEAVEGAGLVKIDLLGLGMLGVIDRCFDLIAQQTRGGPLQRAGERPALHGFRCDDPAVYALLCAADTVGAFQVESRAQISACLPHLQPRCYEDLIVAVALIRPGPIQGHATQPYLRRRRGEEPIRYPGGAAGRRLLEPILGETLGVCLYQDQVIAIGAACGLSPSEAAELRRAMSSARGSERMAALRARLEAGLAAQGLDAAARADVLSMVQAFAGYGFVKGHAAAFAYLAYVSCWLKVHHPAAFYAALLNMQPMGFYPPEVLLQDAERHGVRVLPVDVRDSRADCTLEGGALRLGLRLVCGLGLDACTRLEEALAASPPPRDLEELCTRAHLHEDEARALARSGALRCYVPERRQALWQAPPVARAARERWLPALLAAADPPVRLPAPTPVEDLALDRAALGLAPGRHVLTYLRPDLRHRPLRRADELAALPTATVVEVVGQVIARQRPPTARGVLFLGLSDETGLLNVVVPPSVYQRDRAVVRGEALLWVTGVLERRGGGPTVRATQLRPLAAILRNGF